MKILIVENNEVVKDALFFLLKDDFEIKTACDDSIALQRLSQDRFDIMLFGDKVISPEEGVEFIRHINNVEKFNSQMKIIVMSGRGRNYRLRTAFLSAGADLIIDKIPLRNVVQAVKNIGATI